MGLESDSNLRPSPEELEAAKEFDRRKSLQAGPLDEVIEYDVSERGLKGNVTVHRLNEFVSHQLSSGVETLYRELTPSLKKDRLHLLDGGHVKSFISVVNGFSLMSGMNIEMDIFKGSNHTNVLGGMVERGMKIDEVRKIWREGVKFVVQPNILARVLEWHGEHRSGFSLLECRVKSPAAKISELKRARVREAVIEASKLIHSAVYRLVEQEWPRSSSSSFNANTEIFWEGSLASDVEYFLIDETGRIRVPRMEEQMALVGE